MALHIKEYVSLAEYTTFKIGGNARFFCIADSEEALAEAITYAKKNDLPVFVLGGGSNILVSDEGFPGLVIKIEIEGIEFEENGDDVTASVGAGVNWDFFVEECVVRGVFGVENLSLIPGTVGAAPVQNIGAYGAEVRETIKSVHALNRITLERKVFSNPECVFSYRDSFFKKAEGKNFIITRVVFSLKKNSSLNTAYKDIAEYYARNPEHPKTLRGVRDAVVTIRTKKLPDLEKFGTAGSFFKNPIVGRKHYESLKEKYPDIPSYAVDGESVKIPLAWVLDNVCGFKGYRKDNVGVYQNQALVLVNFGNGTSAQIDTLAKEMMRAVKAKTNIEIEPEVHYVN
jgi:UDP-N-acetylmuramate dehydrogenase